MESRLIAALDRMLRNPTRYRLALFAGQRVRSAEVVVEMINGRPLVVLHSVFNIWTFKNNGTLVPPLRDRPVRARAELALALDSPDPRAIVAEASTLASMTGHTASPLTPDVNYQSSQSLRSESEPRRPQELLHRTHLYAVKNAVMFSALTMAGLPLHLGS